MKAAALKRWNPLTNYKMDIQEEPNLCEKLILFLT
jgi:hypothetical protein